MRLPRLIVLALLGLSVQSKQWQFYTAYGIIGVGAGFVYAGHADIEGARSQWAAELRAADSSLFGTRLGVNGSVGVDLNRLTGKPLLPIEERTVARSTVAPMSCRLAKL